MLRKLIDLIGRLFQSGNTQKIETESVEIRADKRKLSGDWTIEIEHGWPVYAVIPDLPERQQLDERHWPRYKVSGLPTKHVPLRERPQPGMTVIWKGNFDDYIWNFGTIIELDDVLYVESLTCRDHWGSLTYDPARGHWITDGANYTPGLFGRSLQ